MDEDKFRVTVTMQWGAWRYGCRPLRMGRRCVGQVTGYGRGKSRKFGARAGGRDLGVWVTESLARQAVERSFY